MNKFIKTSIFFTIPIILLFGVFFYVDPYNVVRKETNPKLKGLKQEISRKINYSLYTLQDYNWEPSDFIILGDSRAMHLNEESFKKIAGEKVKNLGIASASIAEIVETFWIVNEMHSLKKVYIVISFNQYNARNFKNRVVQSNATRNSLFSYLTSKYCIKSTFLILKSLITNEKINIEKPPFSKEEFWDHQLKITARQSFESYKYPSNYYSDLKSISDYCIDNNIDLIFCIPPTHIDLQKKIKEFDLEKYHSQFKLDLASFGINVLDFNYANNMTKNKKNFGDPYHFDSNFRNIIIEIISSDIKKLPTYYNCVYKVLNRRCQTIFN